MKTMFLTKLKITTAVLLAVVVAAVGVAVATFEAHAARQPQPAKSERRAPQDKDKPKAEPKPLVVQEDAQIRTLAWSSNGKILATVGIVYETAEFTDGDGKPTDSGGVIPHSTIKLWDATTGQLKRSLGEEKDTYIAAIALSADGKTAAISASKHVLTNQRDNPIKFETEVRVVDASRMQEQPTCPNCLITRAISPTLGLTSASRLSPKSSCRRPITSMSHIPRLRNRPCSGYRASRGWGHTSIPGRHRTGAIRRS
jgi:hypothetical protein